MTLFSESVRAFLAPVAPYLDDDEVTEILINSPEDVWVERKGLLVKTSARFTAEGLVAAARNIAQFVGRPLTDDKPRLDARLPDGSRVHVVLPPVARRGTAVSIRKFAREKFGVEDLVRKGSLTRRMGRVLDACIKLKLNVLVSGGTGSGKTTLLNVLSRFIPDEERLVIIEDSAELQIPKPHQVSLESRPPDRNGKGEVDMGELLLSALRLRPDRIIVGEARGGEAFSLLQAMNTGHSGSLTTVHANAPTDALRRLETLCLMSGVELPLRAVRAQVASAIQLIVICARFPDGSRRLTHISEVLPLDEHGDYRVRDLFLFDLSGRDPESGRVLGTHRSTGEVPTFAARFRAYGFADLDAGFFAPATLEETPVEPVRILTEETPRDGVAAAGGAGAAPATPAHGASLGALAAGPSMEPEVDEAEIALQIAEAAVAHDRAGEPKAPPPSPDPVRVIRDEPSIQLAPDLAEEIERRLPGETTLITKRPGGARGAEDTDREKTQPLGHPPRRR